MLSKTRISKSFLPPNLRLLGLTTEEKLVYKSIEAAGNKGIWVKNIRNKINILAKSLDQCIKTLIDKNLIKQCHSVEVLFLFYFIASCS